ncbi:hypothetical protein BACUNI_00933 [Bacteroides uniformis ATCC 8492]|uniref:Transposase n=1 Tax=Bacteroides uniformis (strain ATCC 8492 / DSM 6597 / CCUG 4942 / CIP 103695 / JCM 5828 / KCTC 5204 / NCTC 13054 / VPI 0061) TaxID=411479 RepID=A0ABC9NEW7_BACUC|nr:hypothetical protein BACUNI_00933 [Bacteroides uniformis ATCC 8492]
MIVVPVLRRCGAYKKRRTSSRESFVIFIGNYLRENLV